MSRSVMRTGAIILRRRARLEALSAAIGWFVKRNDYKPLELTHASDYGDVHLMSDGTRIQLTWWLKDRTQPDEPERTHGDGSVCGSRHATDNPNGDVIGEKADDTFGHIVGQMFDAIIGDARQQPSGPNDQRLPAARGQSLTCSLASDVRDQRPCNC